MLTMQALMYSFSGMNTSVFDNKVLRLTYIGIALDVSESRRRP